MTKFYNNFYPKMLCIVDKINDARSCINGAHVVTGDCINPLKRGIIVYIFVK